MVGQKFFVYGGGRWREINLSTGRVAGWGLVEYLSVTHGKLEIIRSDAVLRGLNALAAGKPTSVHDGPQLSQIRRIKTKNVEEPKPINSECQHHQHCCQHTIHSNTDATFNNILQPVTSTVAVQCSIGNKITSPKVTESTINDKLNHTIIKKSNSTSNAKNENYKSNEQSLKGKRSSSESSDVSNTTDSQKTSSDGKATSPARHVQSSKRQKPCNELFIGEDDILLLRTFVEHDDDNVFGVDLERFDTDDFYKCRVFHKLNPLVYVEKSKEITELIKKKSVLTESFKDFMKNLGLQSVEETSEVSSTKYRMRARRNRVKNTTNEFEKENINKDVSWKKTKRSSGVLGERISPVDLRNVKSRRFPSTSGLVKGSKSRPLSKTRNVIPKNNLTKENVLERDKNAMLTNKIEKIEENNLINYYEQAKKNDSLRQDDSLKKRKEKNENELIKQKETNKHNKTTDIKIKENIVDQQKFSDKVISNESNNKESQNDSDLVLGRSHSDKQTEKSKGQKIPRIPVVTAKRGGSTRQPYTSAEDTVMVEWIRGPGRAKQVNGNNLWRELQPIFYRKTGRLRSWHSLRNRYLRSLLPALGKMAIPSDEAARLRAAAAAGELKSKKMLKNSVYEEKRVISAWSRRPRSPLRKSPTPTHHIDFLNSSSDRSRRNHDSDYTPESIESEEPRMYKKIGTNMDKSKRTLRSSAIGTSPKEKQKQTNVRTPTYSELTKRFALKHSTPDSDSAGYNNTDKHVRPTRLLRKDATDRQNAESSVDTTKENNSKDNKTSIFKNNKTRKRKFSSDQKDDDDKNDKNNAIGDQQNSKNNKYLNNSKRRARQISSDRPSTDTNDSTNSGWLNSKNMANNLSFNRRNTRKSLFDKQDADRSNDQRNEKRLRNDDQNSKSIKNNYLKYKKSISNDSTNVDTDTSDDETNTKNVTLKTNNINKIRRSKRNISYERQETITEDQAKTKRLRSTDSMTQNSKKRAHSISTEEEDSDTSDDEKQYKPTRKTINLNKSPNKSSNNRQNTSNDRISQISKKIRKSERHNDNNNFINKNKQNDSHIISNGRRDSSDSSDFVQDVRLVKKLWSINAKTDTGRSKTRRLFNSKAF